MIGDASAWSASLMGGRRIGMRAGLIAVGLAVVALLGLAGCGDDDDAGGALGIPGGEQGGEGADPGANPPDLPELPDMPDLPEGPGEVFGACELLTKAEIAEQFGNYGEVHDGELNPIGCNWPVGGSDDTYLRPSLDLEFYYHPDERFAVLYADGPPDAWLAEVRSWSDVVEVPGADEALFEDTNVIWIRSGEMVITLDAFSFDEAAGESETKLVTLAQLVLDRL